METTINPPSSSSSSRPRPRPTTTIVVGAGLAGLTATLKLLDNNFPVVLFEKEKFFGGNSAKASSGINGIDTNSFDRYGDDIKKYTMDMEYTDLATVLTNGSVEALDWVRTRLDLPLSKISQLGGHSYPRTHRPENGMAGAEIIFALQKKLKQFLKKNKKNNNNNNNNLLIVKKFTKVEDILKNDDNGKIKGVKYLDLKTNKIHEMLGDKIILATGGFGYGDNKLIKKYRPDLGHFSTTNGKWATGDGHILADNIGAKLIEMDHIQVHPTSFVNPKRESSKINVLCAEMLRGSGAILLDKHGNRFCNELGKRDYIVEKMTENSPKDLKFTILLSEKNGKCC